MRQEDRKPQGGYHRPLQCSALESWLNRVWQWVSHYQDYGKFVVDGADRTRSERERLSTGLTRKEAGMNQNQQQLRVHIRWMIRRDMPEVLAIERESFEFPWFEEDFIRCLRQRNCIGMVAEHGERVVGFMIYELHKTRLHILNFAVAHNMRNRAIGRQMAEKLISKLSSQRRTRISLEVRETNLPAQLFFKQVGFRATNVLRSYYEDSPEDAYVMQYYCPTEDYLDSMPVNRIDRLAG